MPGEDDEGLPVVFDGASLRLGKSNFFSALSMLQLRLLILKKLDLLQFVAKSGEFKLEAVIIAFIIDS